MKLLELKGLTADPPSPANGSFFFRSDTGQIIVQEGGAPRRVQLRAGDSQLRGVDVIQRDAGIVEELFNDVPVDGFPVNVNTAMRGKTFILPLYTKGKGTIKIRFHMKDTQSAGTKVVRWQASFLTFISGDVIPALTVLPLTDITLDPSEPSGTQHDEVIGGNDSILATDIDSDHTIVVKIERLGAAAADTAEGQANITNIILSHE